MILSKQKLEIGQDVSFAGHIVGAEGVRPDPVCLDAISNFLTPTDVTALHSFLGQVNQLGINLPDLAGASTKLCVLLHKNVSWVWTPNTTTSSTPSKTSLHLPPSSSISIQHCALSFSPTQGQPASASPSSSTAQTAPPGSSLMDLRASTQLRRGTPRYSWRHLEPPSPFRNVRSTVHAQLPTTFTLIMDHQLSISFFQWPLNECTNNRLQRLRLKVVGANVPFEWEAGKHNFITDDLSRFPPSPEEPMDSAEMEEDRSCIRRTITSNDGGLEWLCDAADENPTYQEIVKAKCNGSSINHLPIDHPARAFRNVWKFISGD